MTPKTSHYWHPRGLPTAYPVHADETLEHGTSYQAVGLSYGEDSAAPQESEGATLFNPGFDVPPEHQHAMRGMTEQQHKVKEQAMSPPAECPGFVACLASVLCLACVHSLGLYHRLQGAHPAGNDTHVCEQVMMQTARFVRHEGDQLELVLRIRQGHNVSFTFLKPDSPLYDYYRWLVQAQPQVCISSGHMSF